MLIVGSITACLFFLLAPFAGQWMLYVWLGLVLTVEYGAALTCRVGGVWRDVIAIGSITDLTLGSVLLLIAPPAELGLVPLAGLGLCMSAVVLMSRLFSGAPLSDWFLPVRGVYARRFLAGVAIALPVLGLPCAACPVIWCDRTCTPNFLVSMFMVASWELWVVAAGLPFYFAPLWAVLVQGWARPTACRSA